jgi:hypothetical protein
MTDDRDVAAKCCSLTRAAAHVYDGIALSSLINYDGVRAFVLREPITEQAFKKKKSLNKDTEDSARLWLARSPPYRRYYFVDSRAERQEAK